MSVERPDVLIIGAGPSGTVASAFLRQKGYSVTILERSHFPRFVIGESMLPQTMDVLERAELLDALKARNYQYKNGALFSYGEHTAVIDFGAQFTPGYAHTWQVPRDDFDHTLAKAVEKKGVDIRFGYTVTDVDMEAEDRPVVSATDDQGGSYTFEPKFILDASGFGRVLPRLLGLDKPSSLPPMQSIFAHMTGDQRVEQDDEQKILIGVHPDEPSTWYWGIPFSDGRTSIGVVGTPEFFEKYPDDPAVALKQLISEEPRAARRLADGEFTAPPRSIKGYSCSATKLYGDRFALLGNAGEFLDPVFSSGVTVAVKSAELATACLHRQLSGEDGDWEAQFSQPMHKGVEVFEAFVRRWYSGSLRDIIFFPSKPNDIYKMLCSCLAGYVWDENNPIVREPNRRLETINKACTMLHPVQ